MFSLLEKLRNLSKRQKLPKIRKLFSKIGSAKKELNPENLSTEARQTETSSPCQSQPLGATGAERYNKSPQKDPSQPTSADTVATATKRPESSTTFLHFTDEKAPEVVELEGSSPPHEAVQAPDDIENHLIPVDDEMGQCTSAPHGRSPSHRHSKHPREPSYDELDARITRLEQEKADVKEKYGKLRQEVRNRRAELDQERQETTRLDEENGQLQLALKNLENIRSQLETTNHKLYEEAAEKERKWRVQDEQLRMYYDGEIDALKRRNWEDQANWNKEKEQLVSSYEKDKEARVSEYRSQQEIWRILEQDLRSGHKEEKNKLSAAHQTEMDCKDKKHAGEIEELKKQHAEENRRLKTQIKAKQQQLASYSSSGSYVARSDQQFRTSFQNLSQDVSNLTALMPHPPNAERVARSDPNGYLMRHLEQLDRSWPRFVQSVCWTALHEGFFALPLGFGALGRQGEGGEKLGQLQRLFEKHIEGAGSDFSTTGKHANIWRATLFDAILREVTSPLPPSPEPNFGALFRSNISRVCETLFAELQKLSVAELDPRVQPQIKKICDGLGLLSLQMGTQRAHILLEVARHGESIKPDEKFSDELNGTVSRIQVDIVTKPCMRRVGDGREDGHTQSIILKGRVVSLKVSGAQVNRRW